MMSDFALNTIARPTSVARTTKVARAFALAGALTLGAAFSVPAQAQSTKIGYVNTDRLLRESASAKAAQAKLENEFKRRDTDLQNQAKTLRSQAEKLEKDAPVLSESDRIKRQRELTTMDSDLRTKRSEFQEDFNRRRNEEFAAIIAKANAAIKRIAESENYDLILQDAVTVAPRVDITDRVMSALGSK